MPELVDEEILTTIKAQLGLQADYAPFDHELIVHINSIIANLTQLGVGPADGLTIDSTTTWSALLSNNAKLQNAKSYIFMRVKMLFDSGTMSQQLVSTYEKMIAEEAWRLQIAADPMKPPYPYANVFNDAGELVTVTVPPVEDEDDEV